MSTGPSRGERRALAVFRVLVACYPGPFRRRHGDAMKATLLQTWRACGDSPAARAWFWLRTTWDLVTEGLAERLRPAPMAQRARDPLTTPHREGPMTGFATDLHRAARALLRSPGFTLLVTVTLALGIGANVAIVSLVDAVVLRPIPVHDPARVVHVQEALNDRSPRGDMSYVTYRGVAEGVREVAGMAAGVHEQAELRLGDRAVSVRVGMVSGNYFDVLGVPAALGRTLADEDEAGWGSEAVVVLSWDLWQRAFGGDPQLVGQSIALGARDFTVVGVAPPRFRGTRLTAATDLWVPVTMAGAVGGDQGVFSRPEILTEPLARLFRVVARVPDGVTPAAVAADLNRARAALPEETAEGVREAMSVIPLREAATPAARGDLVRFLAMLAGVAGLTLLVACVNVANLLLVRARRRARDLAVRAAIGAGRGRLFREQGLEAMLLGLLAGAAAMLTARVAVALLADFTLPGGVAMERVGVELGAGALALAGALGLLSALAFGTLPAWRASRDTLGGIRTRVAGRANPRGWWLLLATQTGLSVVLLVGAALFARTLQEALRTDLGFDADGVAAATVRLRPHGIEMGEALDVVDRMLVAARRSPTVVGAAYATHVPLGPRHIALPFVADEDEEASRGVPINVVTPEYFELLRLPLVAGRTFDARDAADAPPVIMVNEAAARQLWGDVDPVGRVGRITFDREPATVIGVVGQTLYHDLIEGEEPYVYYPLTQLTGPAISLGSLIARAAPGGAPPLEALQAAIHEVDPMLPIEQPRAVAGQLDAVLSVQRFGATLLGIFSGLALLIAAIGIYGVAAWTVATERREIGIRMALGAQARRVLGRVLGRTASATAVGAALGLAAAAALARLVETFLYAVEPLDPGAFTAALLALGAAAALAAWLPALRAVRVDPAETMRSE